MGWVGDGCMYNIFLRIIQWESRLRIVFRRFVEVELFRDQTGVNLNFGDGIE